MDMVVNLRVLRRTWLKVLSFEKMFLRAYLMYFSGDQLSVHIHNKFGDAQVSFLMSPSVSRRQSLEQSNQHAPRVCYVIP